MSQLLRKEDLGPWIEGLLRERTVVAPVRVDELLLFRPIARAGEIVLDSEYTALSPKDFFFLPTEVLFTLERKDGASELTPTAIEREMVLFGLHPCDAKALEIIDKPFLAEPADAVYGQRRARATLVGIACQRPTPECFCTSLGSAPNDHSGLDVLLTEVEEGFIVDMVTEKGQAIMASAPLVESEATPPPPTELKAVPTKGIVETSRQVFEAPYWSRVADRCIHCNVCAYVCPTCYCFDIRDYTSKGRIERVRTWESCQSSGFTRIAGGYDPRPTKGARLRQRFYHKLLYFPEQFGPIACVGCGRCVRACPVNIDIREVIADMQKLGVKDAS